MLWRGLCMRPFCSLFYFGVGFPRGIERRVFPPTDRRVFFFSPWTLSLFTVTTLQEQQSMRDYFSILAEHFSIFMGILWECEAGWLANDTFGFFFPTFNVAVLPLDWGRRLPLWFVIGRVWAEIEHESFHFLFASVRWFLCPSLATRLPCSAFCAGPPTLEEVWRCLEGIKRYQELICDHKRRDVLLGSHRRRLTRNWTIFSENPQTTDMNPPTPNLWPEITKSRKFVFRDSSELQNSNLKFLLYCKPKWHNKANRWELVLAMVLQTIRWNWFYWPTVT